MGGDNFCTIFEYREDTLNRIVNGIADILKNFRKEADSDAIKLDLNFLKLSDDNLEKATNIVSSVLSMASKLNMVTIAEGVETKDQADFLSHRGCALAQGYYYYRPMPVAEFEKLRKADCHRMSDVCHGNGH